MGYSKLLCKLEYIIAKHCYNENFSGGMYFRYPVHFSKNGTEYFVKGDGVANVPEKSLSSMHYEFGTNQLYIGEALLEIIDFVESNFDVLLDDEYWMT